MSRINSSLSWVEHEKKFIISVKGNMLLRWFSGHFYPYLMHKKDFYTEYTVCKY